MEKLVIVTSEPYSDFMNHTTVEYESKEKLIADAKRFHKGYKFPNGWDLKVFGVSSITVSKSKWTDFASCVFTLDEWFERNKTVLPIFPDEFFDD